MANNARPQVAQINARSREAPGGDEEAAVDLKLGEFENVPTLSLSEAKVLINAVKDARRANGGKMHDTEYVGAWKLSLGNNQDDLHYQTTFVSPESHAIQNLSSSFKPMPFFFSRRPKRRKRCT